MRSARYFLRSIFLPGILLVLGGLAAWSAIDSILNAWSSQDWPYVEGRITASEVSSSTQSIGPSKINSTSTSYFPSVSYQYTVNGGPHEGHEIVFGGYSFNSKHEAEEILKRYPLDKIVSVYYNPKKYHRSVLEPGLHELPLVLLFAGIVFAGAGLLVVKLSPKE